jgi:hypothetical protein
VGRWSRLPVYRREQLSRGRVRGPAVVLDYGATTLLRIMRATWWCGRELGCDSLPAHAGGPLVAPAVVRLPRVRGLALVLDCGANKLASDHAGNVVLRSGPVI